MDLINILIIVSAVVVLLLLWVIVGARHLKHLRKDIEDQWELLDEGLRKRQDIIPNLIETVRIYEQGQEELLEKFIRDRQHAAREYPPGAKKIEREHDLSSTINNVIALGKNNRELSTDTNFLELKKEIRDLGVDAMEKTKKYNEMVMYYNKHRKGILLRPLAGISGHKPINIFELES